MKDISEKIKEILNDYIDLSQYSRSGADVRIMNVILDRITALINDNYYDKRFVEWIIHNTMEATTYSPLVYLKYQTIQEIANHGGQWFDLSKEWHLNELFEYWKTNIRDK